MTINYSQVDYSTSSEISRNTFAKKETHIALTAGIVLSIPVPIKNLSYGDPREIVNSTAGYIAVECIDTSDVGRFYGSLNSIVVGPYESIKLRAVLVSGTYYWAVVGQHTRSDELITWAPTLTWTTATPLSLTTSYSTFIQEGVIHFSGYISGANGLGATALTITAPIRPKDRDILMPVVARILVDTTYTDILGYVECADSTNTNRIIGFRNFPTMTSGKSFSIWFNGWYEEVGAGFETFTPTVTYTTSNWDSATTVMRTKTVNGVTFFNFDNRTADAKGVTAGIQTTTPVFSPDTDMYVPVVGYDYCVAGDDSVDYDNNLAVLDAAHATEASRTIASKAVGVMANGKAAQCYWAGIMEAHSWNAFTPVLDWTGTDPTMATLKGRYNVIGQICYFQIYGTSTDGNGCTALVVDLNDAPTPKTTAAKQILSARQVVDTTYSNPMAILYNDQAASDDRNKIYFQNFSTCTDAKTASIMIQGWYPV